MRDFVIKRNIKETLLTVKKVFCMHFSEELGNRGKYRGSSQNIYVCVEDLSTWHKKGKKAFKFAVAMVRKNNII